MDWPMVNGPAVVSVFTIETSAATPVMPPLPVLSVLLLVFGSGSIAVAVALLSKAPAPLIVAVMLMVVLAPEARVAFVHGSDAQAPVTLVMVRFDGVSVTWMLAAADGLPFATTSV